MLHHGHILLLVIAKGEEIVGTFYEKHKSEFRISKVLRQKKNATNFLKRKGYGNSFCA